MDVLTDTADQKKRKKLLLVNILLASVVLPQFENPGLLTPISKFRSGFYIEILSAVL